jgi:nitrite reductase/ring-hydroxylating ferredoxin subunit
VAAIPLGEGRAYVVGDIQIAVFRLRAGAGAERLDALAVCPHAGGPLADGQTDGATVVCPVVDGSCSNGEYAVRFHPVRDDGGELVVEL